MVKYYCDICNKEIKDVDKEGFLEYSVDITHRKVEIFYVHKDCVEKIFGCKERENDT